MKNLVLPVLLTLIIAVGCSTEETVDANDPNAKNPEDLIPENVERADYALLSTNGSNVTGLASLIRNEDDTATLFIKLENASEGLHPATVNFGDTETGGSVAITLERCECEVSETLITQLDNGTPITFDELMVFNGHLNIYESPADDTIISQADIGSNAF